MADFFKFIANLLNSGNKDRGRSVTPSGPQQKPTSDSINNGWNKPYRPLRRIVLWGWDSNNNPSFLILYGKHEFIKPKLLSSNIKYTSYAIFKGSAGHLPSYKPVKIIEEEKSNPEMYFKKGLSYNYGWNKDSQYKYKDYYVLKPEHQLVFPYYKEQTQEQYLSKIEERGLDFAGFRFAKNPNEILQLEETDLKYLNLIVEMLCNQNIYIRKKLMEELISKNPPIKVYKALLNTGSTEVISGLFLALAKKSNPVLLEDAGLLVESEIGWAESNYAKGVKRCAGIYINSLNADFREKRIDRIRGSLSKMDLNLIKLQGRDIPSDKPLEGSAYRKYSARGQLKDYVYEYNYTTRRYTKNEAPVRYEAGPYNDGRRLKLIDFKSTIQEAEIYGLADVIGKAAYYLDAPRLTYYLKGSGKIKAFRYFHRYIIRVINSYAVSNEDKFMEAMKHLLTSYTKYDYVCKYPDNFQYNEFIKYYLYNDFSEKPPDSRKWRARYEWMSHDQLMKLEGRHEYMKEIWDRHLDVVADIAIGSQVDQVTKPCYNILKDSPNAGMFIENINYEQLVNLTLVSYKPLSQMFKSILKDKTGKMTSFDSELMLALLGCPDENLQKDAMAYFERTKGLFSPQVIADMLLLKNLGQWTGLFRQNLLMLEGDRYGEFIRRLIERSEEISRTVGTIPDDIPHILEASSDKIQNLSVILKIEIITGTVSLLSDGTKLPDWLLAYLEEIIFSFVPEELKSILDTVELGSMKRSGLERNKRIISVLESIKNGKLPSDTKIIDILECGTSKMIRMLVILFDENREELQNRFSTLLIMFESGITALNRKAEEIFDSLPQDRQRKLHSIIIDSPVKSAYSAGLEKLNRIYKEMLPGEFIIQMLEHGSPDVKTYISDKISRIFDNLEKCNTGLIMYYIKTLLLLPNRNSMSKDRVYAVLPQFARINPDKLEEIESILLDMGGSNVIKDSERALVTLARIRKEGRQNAG